MPFTNFFGRVFVPTFAERLKELRKAKGLTQKALGELIEASEGSIQSYELEYRAPTLAVINKLADCFEVTTDYLLGRTDLKTLPATPDSP